MRFTPPDKIAAGILIVSFLVSGFLILPEENEAEAVSVTVVGSILEPIAANMLSVLTFISDQFNAITIKEYILDDLAWQIANMLIDQMAADIVDWINTGFDGNPAFVEDFGGYLGKVADQTAGAFIEELGAGFLCSPFALDVQLATALDYYAPYQERARCTLSDVVGNTESFLNGNFSEGGWPGWFSLTANPSNNPYGATLAARNELRIRISSAQYNETKVLEFGKGFFSKKECDTDAAGNEVNCKIVTPGATIESQLNTALELPAGRLTVADEINEIIGALLNQMVRQVLGGAGGLSGASRSSGSTPSFTDRLRTQGLSGDSAESAGGVIRNAIDTEQKYKAMKERSLSIVDTTEAQLRIAQTCWKNKSTDPGRDGASAALGQYDARIAEIEERIKSGIVPEQERLKRDIASSTAITANLTALQARAETSKDAEELKAVVDEFLAAPKHSLSDVLSAEREIDTTSDLMSPLLQYANAQLDLCQRGRNDGGDGEGSGDRGE